MRPLRAGRKKSGGLDFFGFEQGLRLKDLEEVLAQASLNHYNDFGHSLIYVFKSAQLSAFLDDNEVDRALALSLARSITYATREDLIPEFKGYGATVKALEDSSFGDRTYSDHLDKMNTSQCYEWLREKQTKYSISSLYQTLLYANALNLLQCEISPKVGWLSFTHGVTFANAVRMACEKDPETMAQGIGPNGKFLRQKLFLYRSCHPFRGLGRWSLPRSSGH